MCRGCKIRERLIQRIGAQAADAFRKLDAANDAVRALVVDTSGPTKRAPTQSGRSSPAVSGPQASPAARGEKPAPNSIQRPRAKQRAAQLSLAL